MSHKTVAFQFERCLESNAHARTLCSTFLKHGYAIYLISDLPEREFYNKVCDFALDRGIYYKNILFRKLGKADNLVEQLGLTLFFSANEVEVQALNQRLPRPVACHLPEEQVTD